MKVFVPIDIRQASLNRFYSELIYAVCSSWVELHQEIERIQQLFVNNNFPMCLIDETVRSFLSSRIGGNGAVCDKQPINFYFKNQMSATYKQDEKQLMDIFHKHVSPSDPSNEVKLTIYYKSKKLSNLFIKNNVHSNPRETANRHHVVYQYTCSRDGCQATQNTYIGSRRAR